MVGDIKVMLLKRPDTAFISQQFSDESYKRCGWFNSPNYEKSIKEYEAFERIITDHVPEVYFLPQDEGTELDSIYAHDSFKITKKGVIYFTMGKVSRKGEPAAARKYLESIGIPTLGQIEPPGTVEGGDVLWLDEKTAAIGRSYRTNDEGIRQFAELVKGFIEVIPVPIPHADGQDYILHLMSLISPVDNDLAVVYSKYMPCFFREMLIERGIELIETPDDEYDILGTNVLALAPRKCVMLKGSPKVKEMLIKAGAEVIEYEGDNISIPGTGGATCFTAPLYRE
jgi:N-dimethylarginine dimethylaminohydrolase